MDRVLVYLTQVSVIFDHNASRKKPWYTMGLSLSPFGAIKMPDERFETGKAMVSDALAFLVSIGMISQEQMDAVMLALAFEDMEELTKVYHGLEGLERIDVDIRISYLDTHIYNKSVLQKRLRQQVSDQHVRRVFLAILLGTYPA